MTGKRPIILILFIFLLAFAASAQSISIKGRVEDQANKAIAGATVVLRNQKTGLERIVSTDREGRFTFSASGGDKYEVIGSARGFARVIKPVDDAQGELVLNLEPDAIREEVTVVSGSRREELRESLNTRVEVVSAEDIKKTGYETVGEVLREVPGVVTRRGSETAGAAGEQVQGIDSRQVLVLADGQPIVGARGIKSGVINLDRQAVGSLDSVEVVKGAASALYGSDAIGGVINLRTKEPGKPFSNTVTAGAGNFGVVDLRDDLSFKHDSLGGVFSFGRHKNNGFDLNPATYITEGAGFHRYDAYGKLKYQFNDNFSLLGFANSYWNESLGRVQGEPVVSGDNGLQTNNVKDNAQNYGLTADWSINDRTALQARGYFSRYDEVVRGARQINGAAIPEGNLFQRYGKVDATVSHLLGERQFIQAGVEFTIDRYSGINRLQNDKARAETQVIWAQDKINIVKRLTFTIGGRFDHHSIFGSAGSPKFGLNYKVTDWASLRASWGRGFRAPDLGQLRYRFANPSSFYQVIGNPNLVPEHSGSWQVGGEFTTPDRKGRLGVNYFRNDIRNLINSVSLGFIAPNATQASIQALLIANGADPSVSTFVQSGLLLFIYKNTARAYTTGGEADASYALPLGFTVSGAYTYLDARNADNKFYLTGRNKHQGMAKLAYDNVRYGFGANLRGSFYSRWIVSQTGAGINTYAPGFQLWDLYGSKKLPGGAEVYGSIDNLFDSQDPNTGTAGSIFRPDAGRTFRVGMRWNFDRDE
jgi:outer membrane receptor for ferrienterochelin and colicins